MQLPYDQYVMPALAGLKISVTGATAQQQRSMLAKQIEGAGALHSADLVKDCTHLIAFSSMSGTSNKHKCGTGLMCTAACACAQGTCAHCRYAQSWGVPIVSVLWLEASIANGFPVVWCCLHTASRQQRTHVHVAV
jgi:hypothetical protein